MRRVTVVLAAAITLGACGADTPETLGAALADAASTLGYVEPGEQTCVGEAVLDGLGFDALIEQGISSEALALEPESFTDLVEVEGTDELREAIQGCVDSDRLFRMALADHAADPLMCAADFPSDDTLVDGYVAGIVAGLEPKLDIDDSDDNRDLLRACLSEVDFARTFGLDLPEALAMAVTTDLTDTLTEGLIDAECFGDGVVAELGVERLDQLGVVVESAEVDIDELDLSESETATFIEAALRCESVLDHQQPELMKAEPAFFECMIERLDEEYIDSVVRHELGEQDARRETNRLRQAALGVCVRERATELFGSLTTAEGLAARQFARDVASSLFYTADGAADYSKTRATLECAAHGLYADLGAETVTEQVDHLWSTSDLTDLEWAMLDTIYGGFLRRMRDCTGDWVLLGNELYRAGFSAGTLACVEEIVALDIEHTADAYANTFTLDEQEYWANITTLERFVDDVDASLDLCIDASEEGILDDYRDWLDDPLEGDLFADTNDPDLPI